MKIFVISTVKLNLNFRKDCRIFRNQCRIFRNDMMLMCLDEFGLELASKCKKISQNPVKNIKSFTILIQKRSRSKK